jgi:hypothetical protein
VISYIEENKEQKSKQCHDILTLLKKNTKQKTKQNKNHRRTAVTVFPTSATGHVFIQFPQTGHSLHVI